MSEHPSDICAECGHERRQHIYNEGACRPGFVCPAGCTGFRETWGPCPTCGATQKYDSVALGYQCQGVCLGNPGYWQERFERLQKAAIAYAAHDDLSTLHELLDAAGVPKAGQ